MFWRDAFAGCCALGLERDRLDNDDDRFGDDVPLPRPEVLLDDSGGDMFTPAALRPCWSANQQLPVVPKTISLGVKIVSARYAPRNAHASSMDIQTGYFCRCEIEGKEQLNTGVVECDGHPCWDFDGTLDTFVTGDVIKFSMFKFGPLHMPKQVGRLSMSTGAFYPNGFSGAVALETESDGGGDPTRPSAFLSVSLTAANEFHPDAPPPLTEFVVKLIPHQQMRIGVELDYLDGQTLYVCSVGPGLIQDYNRSELEDLATDRVVREGDYIMCGNAHGVGGLNERLIRDGKLVLTVRRPEEYVVTIGVKGSSTLGLDVKSDPSLRHILVTRVLESGPVHSHNLRVWEDTQVRPGDRIVAANGQRGTAKDLLRILKDVADCESITLRLRRPSADPFSLCPVDVSRLSRVARDDKGLLSQPPQPLYKIALVEVCIRSSWHGGPDKSSNGHRYDTIPIANGMISNGMSCQLIQYVHEEQVAFFQTCKAFDALIIRCRPCHIVADGGNPAHFDAMIVNLRALGVTIWSSSSVVEHMTGNDALYRIRHLKVGMEETSLYTTAQAFEEGFRRTVAFQPRLIRPSKDIYGDSLWIAELEDGNYCQTFGQRCCDDSEVLVLTDTRDGHKERHALGEFTEFCVRGKTAAAGSWSCESQGRYFDTCGLVDQRFCPRISEGELRFHMLGDEVIGLAMKTRVTRSDDMALGDCGGCDGSTCCCTYAHLAPSDPRFAALVSDFMSRDMPVLMQCFKLESEPVPLWWTLDFVNVSPRGTSLNQERWAALGFGVSCVGISQYLAACHSQAHPYACVDCVSPLDRTDAADLGHGLGTYVLDVLNGGHGLDSKRFVGT